MGKGKRKAHSIQAIVRGSGPFLSDDLMHHLVCKDGFKKSRWQPSGAYKKTRQSFDYMAAILTLFLPYSAALLEGE